MGSLGAGDGCRRSPLIPPCHPARSPSLHPYRHAAWPILVAVEMLAAVPWGLGWLIFGARKFLNTDVMLAGIVVIAVIGLALEKLVFQKIENYTVVRWGMISS